jgi:hypothetical protein
MKNKEKFKVGAKVRILMPGINGVVKQGSDELGPLGEYWHVIETKSGERKEPGSNLELIHVEQG